MDSVTKLILRNPDYRHSLVICVTQFWTSSVAFITKTTLTTLSWSLSVRSHSLLKKST